MILYFASNLIWATRIKSLADDLGLPCRPVRNPDMLDARLADSPVRALVVDLDAGEPAIDLIRHLRAAGRAASPTQSSAPPPFASPGDSGSDGPGAADSGDSGGGDGAAANARRVRVVAFGPHVARDLLQRARDAGADEVLTRGAFDHNLPEILMSLGSAG